MKLEESDEEFLYIDLNLSDDKIKKKMISTKKVRKPNNK